MNLLNNHLLIERVFRDKSSGGILLPDVAQDDYNTGGIKEYRVLEVGPGKMTKYGRTPIPCVPGDRVLCHSYTSGPAELGGNRFIITDDQIVAVLPSSCPSTISAPHPC